MKREPLKNDDMNGENAQQTAEKLMANVSQLLEDAENGSVVSREQWEASCDDMGRAGQATWYRCACGIIEPTSGMIDVICSKCGERRILPNRLQRAPWSLYVAVLKHLAPDSWFERLSEWMVQQALGEVVAVRTPCRRHRGAYEPQANSDAPGGAYPSNATDSAAPPMIKQIACIDGMVIRSNGDIGGICWIALPMAPSSFFTASACVSP